MRQSDVELAIGDSVQIGNHVLTVMEIQGEEITFRLDNAEEVDVTVAATTFTGRRPPR
jgi:riboflavin synthase alpha subunit